MKSILLLAISSLFVLDCFGQSSDYGQEYIAAWKDFHPSKALAQGMHSSIYNFEDLEVDKIQAWISYNEKVLGNLSDPDDKYVKTQSANARLLRVQITNELQDWKVNSISKHSLTLYSSLISKSVKNVISANFLNGNEKQYLVCQRIRDVENLCEQAKRNLTHIPNHDFVAGTKQLQKTIDWYQDEFPSIVEKWNSSNDCSNFAEESQRVAYLLEDLHEFAQSKVASVTTKANHNILGYDEYARRLILYTDGDIRPEQMAQLAQQEILEVKSLIAETSLSYLKSKYPGRSLPEDTEKIIGLAFQDMEKDVPLNADDYTRFWEELSSDAQSFIDANNIATLPRINTLRIIPAPESAGPAARIGWVDSASPFDPNPITTLYLPSIPDTLPVQEQIDFWASFNKPFNRMIAIHELFPGHYMQIKTSRETPHHVRLLFPYAPYFEGWATFTEKVLLDAGWDKERPLTYLAHLRKRIENANRAYTSVQVHTNAWTQEDVMKHSTETALLAPQFAKSLWGRIMRSPMQLTSYFWGGHKFKQLMNDEKNRLDDDFNLKQFMDTIMKTGPVPIDEFYDIFKSMN